MSRELRFKLACALVVAGVSGAPSCSRDAATTAARAPIPIAYRYDAGPGRLGEQVDLSDLGVGATRATKVGRRTYEDTQSGSTSRFTIAPRRYTQALAAASAAASTVPVACGALGAWFAGALHSSLTATADLVDDGLPVVDRSFALLQHVADPEYRVRRTIAAAHCDAGRVASAAAARVTAGDWREIGRLMGTGSIDPTQFVTSLLTP